MPKQAPYSIEIEATRRKWNRKYLDPPSPSLSPEPHLLAEQWKDRLIGGNMLDAACGLGRGIASVDDRFDAIYAVDLSDVAVYHARELWHRDPRIRWIVGDVTRLNWPPDFFGLICAFGFTDLPFFARLRVWMKLGGMFLYQGFSERHLTVKPDFNPDWTTTPARLGEMFSDWEILSIEETDTAPFRVSIAAVIAGKDNGK